MLVTAKEWLKSVLNYRSYPKNKIGSAYPFLDHPVVWLLVPTLFTTNQTRCNKTTVLIAYFYFVVYAVLYVSFILFWRQLTSWPFMLLTLLSRLPVSHPLVIYNMRNLFANYGLPALFRCRVLIPNSTCCHVVTRLTHHFGTKKVVTCCVTFVAQHGATRSSQVRLARHVFRGTRPSHFFQLFLRWMQIQSTKD